MFIVYILQNLSSNRHYIGSTNNLERRIEEHNRGQTKSTRQNGVWKVLYVEEYNTSLEAKRREKIIKSYKGGQAFKRLIAGLGRIPILHVRYQCWGCNTKGRNPK